MGGWLNHPTLKVVMSREARQLRDAVVDKSIECGTSGMLPADMKKFIDTFMAAYNPMVWECPVMYAHVSEIWNAFLRMTSAAYKDQQKAGRETRGNVTGIRRKDIDWLSIIISFPDTWWMSSVQEKRKGSIALCNLDGVLKPFEDMYRLYTNWLIADFSVKTLFGIFDVSKRYSIEIVKECMDAVDNVRNRSFEYLMAIIDREFAARQIEMMQNKELLDKSKDILNAVIDMARSKSEHIDWEFIEKDTSTIKENEDEFDKIKLT